MTTVIYMSIALMIMIAALGIFGMIFNLRRKYVKMAEKYILCDFRTATGQRYEKFFQYNGQTISVKHNGKEPTTYFAREDAIYDIQYPREGMLASLVATKMPSISFNEGNSEPIVKRRETDNVTNPKLIRALQDEKFMDLSLKASREISELQDKLDRVLNPMIVYLLLVAAAACGAVGVYFIVQMKSQLGVVINALGV